MAWTPTQWQRGLFPAEYREGVSVKRSGPSAIHEAADG